VTVELLWLTLEPGRDSSTETMRVTLVTETYYPQVNGVSRTLGELVRFLDHEGDKVQLVHPDYGETPHGEQSHTVRSLSLPSYKELFIPLPPFGPVHRAIDSFGPDIIHIATEATLGYSALRFALRRRIAVVSSFHTNFDQYSRHYRVGWTRGLINRYLRWFHNQTRETFVPSDVTIKALRQLGFERLVLWRRGVDGDLFRPDQERRLEVRRDLGWRPEDVVITYVSRIAPEKNVEYLAAALALVATRRPDVRVMFVGDGPSRRAIEQQIGSFTHFAGYRRGEDLARYYSASDIFAFSSLTETFGNVVLEAMASGLPVVALAAGGVAETVQSGTTGILIAPAEAPSLFATSVLQLVEQPDERRRMAEAARNYALCQTWDAIMAGLRERYLRIIDQPVARSVPAAQASR
jgi:glycosyltransferase involved in cell wall biosynthesis